MMFIHEGIELEYMVRVTVVVKWHISRLLYSSNVILKVHNLQVANYVYFCALQRDNLPITKHAG